MRSVDDIAESTRRVMAKSVDGFEDLPLEKRIVYLLLHDLCDRRGFKYVWESIGASMREEIEAVWTKMVVDEIEGTARDRAAWDDMNRLSGKILQEGDRA